MISTKKNFTGIISLLIILILSSCSKICEKGDGPIIEKELTLAYFNGINLASSFDVEIAQGEEQKVIAVGHGNIINDLKTKVSNDVWKIDLGDGCHRNFTLRIEITVPEINKIKLSGSGNITATGFDNLDNLEVICDGSGNINSVGTFYVGNKVEIDNDGSGDIEITVDCNELEAEVDGSGKIRLAGATPYARLKIDGSGDLRAYDLLIQNCLIHSNASGNAKIMVEQTLEAYLSGSGDVRYRGYPSIQQDRDGSGKLINDN